MTRRLSFLFNHLFRRARLDRDMAEEMRAHLELRAAELEQAGVAPQEAWRRARLEFGGVENYKEQCRETRRFHLLHDFLSDLRYGLRMLRKSPGFTAVAVITLALGIGANTAIFSLTYALLLKSLPVVEPERLVHFKDPQSGPLFDALRAANGTNSGPFQGVFGWYGGLFNSLSFRENGQSRNLPFALISGDGFPLLGLKPSAGRLLGPADDQAGGAPDGWHCVLSYGYWKQHFNADPSAIGRVLVLNDTPVTIIGVAPASFESLTAGERPRVYLPLEFAATFGQTRHRPDSIWLDIYGRLAPGVTQGQARAFVEASKVGLYSSIFSGSKSDSKRAWWVKRGLAIETGAHGHSWLAELYRLPLLLLQGLALLTLLLCCVSLAGLFSARALALRRDLVLRRVLGAGRGRLVLQVIAEVLPILVVGVGLALAFAGRLAQFVIHNILLNVSADLQFDFSPNLTTVAVTVLAGAITCLVACLAPLRAVLRVDAAEELKAGNSPGLSRRVRRNFGWFVPVQIAVATVLVVAAALFGGTFLRLLTTNLGFRADGLVWYSVAAPDRPAPADGRKGAPPDPQEQARLQAEASARVAQVYGNLVERLRTMPGVTNVATVFYRPMGGGSAPTEISLGRGEPVTANLNFAGPGYLSTMNTRLLAGRDFTPADRPGAAPVCVLSALAAQRLFAGSAVGQTVSYTRFPERHVRCNIVGIAEDTKFSDLEEQMKPMIYISWAQCPWLYGGNLMVRTDNLALADSSVRQALREIVPGSKVNETAVLSEDIYRSIARERILAILAILFAGLAVLVSCIGLYGVLAYHVHRRIPEIGVRLALGASPRSISRLFLRRAYVYLLSGSAVGLFTAFALARYVQSLLYGVGPRAWWVYAGCWGIIAITVLLAAYLPARRAAKVDPMVALRYE